jgi:hypothetical protein
MATVSIRIKPRAKPEPRGFFTRFATRFYEGRMRTAIREIERRSFMLGQGR